MIVQAGASEAGRQLAAETAEVIFGTSSNIANARTFYGDVKGRMRKLGRDPDHLKVLPGAFVVVANLSRKRVKSGRGLIVLCTTTAPSRHYRSRLRHDTRALILKARCLRFRKATPAGVDTNASLNWRSGKS